MKNLILSVALLLAAPAMLLAQDAPPPQAGPHGHSGERGGPAHEGGPGRDGGHDGGLMMPPGAWWRNADVVAKVGLSADQTAKIDKIFTDSRVQLIQMHATLEEEQVKLESAMNAVPFDQGKALASIDKSAEIRAGLEKANARMLLGIRAVLTPEQWTKLQALHKPGEHPAPGPEGPGRRGQRGAGGPPPAEE